MNSQTSINGGLLSVSPQKGQKQSLMPNSSPMVQVSHGVNDLPQIMNANSLNTPVKYTSTILSPINAYQSVLQQNSHKVKRKDSHMSKSTPITVNVQQTNQQGHKNQQANSNNLSNQSPATKSNFLPSLQGNGNGSISQNQQQQPQNQTINLAGKQQYNSQVAFPAKRAKLANLKNRQQSVEPAKDFNALNQELLKQIDQSQQLQQYYQQEGRYLRTKAAINQTQTNLPQQKVNSPPQQVFLQSLSPQQAQENMASSKAMNIAAGNVVRQLNEKLAKIKNKPEFQNLPTQPESKNALEATEIGNLDYIAANPQRAFVKVKQKAPSINHHVNKKIKLALESHRPRELSPKPLVKGGFDHYGGGHVQQLRKPDYSNISNAQDKVSATGLKLRNLQNDMQAKTIQQLTGDRFSSLQQKENAFKQQQLQGNNIYDGNSGTQNTEGGQMNSTARQQNFYYQQSQNMYQTAQQQSQDDVSDDNMYYLDENPADSFIIQPVMNQLKNKNKIIQSNPATKLNNHSTLNDEKLINSDQNQHSILNFQDIDDPLRVVNRNPSKSHHSRSPGPLNKQNSSQAVKFKGNKDKQFDQNNINQDSKQQLSTSIHNSHQTPSKIHMNSFYTVNKKTHSVADQALLHPPLPIPNFTDSNSPTRILRNGKMPLHVLPQSQFMRNLSDSKSPNDRENKQSDQQDAKESSATKSPQADKAPPVVQLSQFGSFMKNQSSYCTGYLKKKQLQSHSFATPKKYQKLSSRLLVAKENMEPSRKQQPLLIVHADGPIGYFDEEKKYTYKEKIVPHLVSLSHNFRIILFSNESRVVTVSLCNQLASHKKGFVFDAVYCSKLRYRDTINFTQILMDQFDTKSDEECQNCAKQTVVLVSDRKQIPDVACKPLKPTDYFKCEKELQEKMNHRVPVILKMPHLRLYRNISFDPVYQLLISLLVTSQLSNETDSMITFDEQSAKISLPSKEKQIIASILPEKHAQFGKLMPKTKGFVLETLIKTGTNFHKGFKQTYEAYLNQQSDWLKLVVNNNKYQSIKDRLINIRKEMPKPPAPTKESSERVFKLKTDEAYKRYINVLKRNERVRKDIKKYRVKFWVDMEYEMAEEESSDEDDPNADIGVEDLYSDEDEFSDYEYEKPLKYKFMNLKLKDSGQKAEAQAKWIDLECGLKLKQKPDCYIEVLSKKQPPLMFYTSQAQHLQNAAGLQDEAQIIELKKQMTIRENARALLEHKKTKAF